MNDYKVKILRARLEIGRFKLSPNVINDHNRMLQTKNALYPLRHSTIKTFSILRGSMHVVRENVFVGHIPRRIVVTLIDAKNWSGQRDKNPFNFVHQNLSYICLYLDGLRIPNRALTPDFSLNGDWVEAYQTLFDGTGLRNDNASIAIDREDFAQGYTMYVLPTTHGEPDSTAYDVVQRGQIRLEMKFKEAIPSTTTAIIYAEFDGQIELDRDRNVYETFK